jgi:metallo-beta-lactamase family protein
MAKKENMKISFVDSMSAEDVTGSSVLVEAPNCKILLDCGFYQSNDKKKDFLINKRNAKEYKPKDLDFVFACHTHYDHIGKIPKIYKEGFCGKTIVPNGSKEIMKRMFIDCAYINERDIEIINKQEGTNYYPLYSNEDIDYCYNYIYEYDINKKIKINDEISFMFIPSGHLLNACQLLLWITYDNITKCIGYTSDIGNKYIDNKFVGKFEPLEKCDILIGESTYGDRKDLKIKNKERKNDYEKLKSIIDTQVIQMNGRLIIPSFAQSRPLQVIGMIYDLYKDTEFSCKVYLDSPLAIDLLKLVENNLIGEELDYYKNLLNWSNLVLVKESEDSKLLSRSKESCIIISTSGMCNVGRIRHHFKSMVGNANATILFCGYSSENSLASILKNPKTQEISIDKKYYPVKCSVNNLKSLSGHAMYQQLLDYYSKVNCNKIILHHGSKEAKEILAKDLKKVLEKECKTTRVICANNSLKFTL